MQASILYALARVPVVFSLFVLRVWTGPPGAASAAVAMHSLLRFCAGQRGGQPAPERKTRDTVLHDATVRDDRCI